MKNFKRTIALVLALIMVFALCACGEKEPTADPADSAEPVPQDESIELVISIGNYANNSAFYAGMEKFVEKVGEYSNGTVTGTIFTDNSLGDLASQVDALIDGSIDVFVAGDTYFATYYNALSALELPFLFESEEEARYVLDNEAGDFIKTQYEGSGIKVLNFWEVGMRQFTSNGKMLNSIDDVKGLRLRVLPVEIQVWAWEHFGAQCMPIDGAELFSALQTGVVDAQENPLEGIWANKLYEAQEYISLTNHVFTPATCAISEKTWAKLSDTQKAAVEKAMDEATAEFRSIATANTQNALSELKKVREVNENPDVSGFVALSQDVYDKFAETCPDSVQLLEAVYTARDAFRAK